MFQDFINHRFPWYVVATINFASFMAVSYLFIAICSKFIDWMWFDTPYIMAGALWYSFIQHKVWKRKLKQD